MKKAILSGIAFLSVLSISLLVFQTSCSTDKCKNVTCQNGGTCASGTCTCASGYEGTLCDTAIRDKFIVSGGFTENCGSGPSTYNISITKGTAVTDILIQNLGNYSFLDGSGHAVTSYNVTATENGHKTFNIPSQVLYGTTFTGSGTITGGKIVISYTATYPKTGGGTQTDNCTATQN